MQIVDGQDDATDNKNDDVSDLVGFTVKARHPITYTKPERIDSTTHSTPCGTCPSLLHTSKAAQPRAKREKQHEHKLPLTLTRRAKHRYTPTVRDDSTSNIVQLPNHGVEDGQPHIVHLVLGLVSSSCTDTSIHLVHHQLQHTMPHSQHMHVNCEIIIV